MMPCFCIYGIHDYQLCLGLIQSLNQIAAVQEFLNENAQADLSRVKCLLRKIVKEYHDVIDKLKQRQCLQIIINIHGGQNLIAPNATEVTTNT